MIAIMDETGLVDEAMGHRCERCGAMEAPADGLRRQARGFPSPAEIYVEGRLELGQHLVRHPTATYFARMSGDGMASCGILDGDLLVIDRSEPIFNGSVVVVRVGEEMLIRKLNLEDGRRLLVNDSDQPIELSGELDHEIWGRVIHSIRKH